MSGEIAAVPAHPDVVPAQHSHRGEEDRRGEQFLPDPGDGRRNRAGAEGDTDRAENPGGTGTSPAGDAATGNPDSDEGAASDSPVQRCEALLPGFDDNPTDIKHEVEQGNITQPVAVRLTWTRSDAYGTDRTGWIICFFLPRSETKGLWQIDLVDSQKFGKMKRYDVQQLNKLLYLRHHSHVDENPHPKPTVWTPYLYYLQQTLNAVTLGFLYALLAVGFTLIYGITRFINLAFGDLYMTAAFSTYVAYILSAVCASFVGILLAMRIGIGNPTQAEGWELQAIASSVIGGTSLFGAIGSIHGPLLGSFILTTINNGANLLNLNSFWQRIITGLLIIVIVYFDGLRRKKR